MVRVVPVAPVPLILHAELADGSTMDGQSQIMRTSGIRRVWITPDDVRAADEAVDAIATADLVLYGPGSLYTSILPSLLVPGMREALEQTAASRLFVCNVATQVGETEGYSLADHMAAFRAHGLDGAIDAILLNNNFRARVPENYPAAPVRGDAADLGPGAPQVFMRDVVDDDNAHRHDSAKLAAAINLLHGAPRHQAPAGSPGHINAGGSVTEAERDLVGAIRAELAAIEPARRCDRRALRSGLGDGCAAAGRPPDRADPGAPGTRG